MCGQKVCVSNWPHSSEGKSQAATISQWFWVQLCPGSRGAVLVHSRTSVLVASLQSLSLRGRANWKGERLTSPSDYTRH